MSSTKYTSVFLVRTENKEGKNHNRYVKITFPSQKVKEDSESDFYDTARDQIQTKLDQVFPGEMITTTGDEDIEEAGDRTEFNFEILVE